MIAGSPPPSAGARLRACFALDLRSLALFRVALGAALLLDLATRAADLRAHYTDAGVLPRRTFFALYPGDAQWSLHVATGSALGEGALFVIAAAVAALLLVGFRARLMCVLAFILTVSLQDRNLVVFYGFDLLLRVCLLWGAFLPLGARFSVDARAPRARSSGDAVLSAGAVALTLQMAFVYVFSALQKSEDASWLDLSAMFYAVTADTHATAFARALAPHTSLLRALTLVVVVVELCGPLLLFVPALVPAWRDRARVAVVALFAAFHLFTAVLFTLGLFPLMGIFAWLPFLPASVWTRASSSTSAASAPTSGVTRRAEALVAGALLAVIAAYNAQSVGVAGAVPAGLDRVARVLHLEQTWNMFSRPMADGWFVAEAVMDGGKRRVDILTRGRPVDFKKPASVSATFPSMRWRKYMTMLLRPGSAQHRDPFLRYLCRHWDGADAVNLWFVREVEREDGASSSTERELLGSLPCN